MKRVNVNDIQSILRKRKKMTTTDLMLLGFTIRQSRYALNTLVEKGIAIKRYNLHDMRHPIYFLAEEYADGIPVSEVRC